MRVEAARVGVAEEVGAREILFEEAVDLGADLAKEKRGPPPVSFLHLVELQARVGAARDLHARVLDDVEDEQVRADRRAAAQLEGAPRRRGSPRFT